MKLHFLIIATLLAITRNAALRLHSATRKVSFPPCACGTRCAARFDRRDDERRIKSFEVWFSQVQNDRWGCMGSEHIIVYENGYGVTPESYKQMFALATLAQTTGKPLALDSSGTNPCSNVNMAWVVGTAVQGSHAEELRACSDAGLERAAGKVLHDAAALAHS